MAPVPGSVLRSEKVRGMVSAKIGNFARENWSGQMPTEKHRRPGPTIFLNLETDACRLIPKHPEKISYRLLCFGVRRNDSRSRSSHFAKSASADSSSSLLIRPRFKASKNARVRVL